MSAGHLTTLTARCAVALALALAAACADPPTQVAVRLASDMRASELDGLTLTLLDRSGDEVRRQELFDLTLPGDGRFHTVGTFGVVPRDADPTRRFEVRVAARLGGASLFETRARTGFVRGRTIRLDLYVPRECVEVARTCRPDETCGVAGCVDPEVPEGSLDEGDGDVEPEARPEDRRVATQPFVQAPTSGAVLATDRPTITVAGGGDLSLRVCPTARCGGDEDVIVPVVDGRATPELLDGERYFLTPMRTRPDGERVDGPQILVEVSAPTDPALRRDAACGRRLDLTVDGVPDVVVGDPAATPRGRVHVLAGPPSDGWSDVVVMGPDGAAAFGRALDAAGDVDRDGKPDLVVGAPGAGGTAWIVRGGHLDEPPRRLSLDGALRFGEAVAGAGDLDGDGYADVAVADPGGGAWRVAVFRGGRDGPSDEPWVVLDAPAGDESSEVALAGGGDLTGDGRDDLVVGALGARGSGAVFLVEGGDDLALAPFPAAESLDTGWEYGAAVAVGLVAPGRCGAVVTAPGRAGSEGGAYVFDGSPIAFETFLGGSGIPGARLGAALALGRLDEPGRDAILLGEVGEGSWRVSIHDRRGRSAADVPLGPGDLPMRLSLPGDMLGDDLASELVALEQMQPLRAFTGLPTAATPAGSVAVPAGAAQFGRSLR